MFLPLEDCSESTQFLQKRTSKADFEIKDTAENVKTGSRPIFIVNYRQKQWKTWRILCGFMSVFFCCCSYVQLNDPDHFLWILAYILPSIITGTIAVSSRLSTDLQYQKNLFQRLDKLILFHVIYCFFLGIWTLVYAFTLKHGIWINKGTFSEEKMMAEEAKELLGLCLIISLLSILRDRTFLRLGHIGICIGTCLTVVPIIAWICVEWFEDSEKSCSH